MQLSLPRRYAAAITAIMVLGAALAALPITPAAGADVGCGATEIGGTIYRDYNSSGAQDAAEPGEAGITVTAYDAAGQRQDPWQ